MDTFNMLGITPYSHKKFYKEKEISLDDVINNAFCELSKDRGNYELLFPKEENINRYLKYFLSAVEENNIFWNKILDNNDE